MKFSRQLSAELGPTRSYAIATIRELLVEHSYLSVRRPRSVGRDRAEHYIEEDLMKGLLIEQQPDHSGETPTASPTGAPGAVGMAISEEDQFAYDKWADDGGNNLD